ncbi:MAG: Hsp20/alpha crystallin family protein, partial [Acidipropionibacterium jensenii]|nr:Hsp20/alpha crystallin family protein [Acidipropionibacterium jensenii]
MARTFDSLSEMDRLFSGVSRTPASVAMPMDLYRDGDSYVAELDLPGVDPASIDIDIDGQTLTIRAERSSHTGEQSQWLTR